MKIIEKQTKTQNLLRLKDNRKEKLLNIIKDYIPNNLDIYSKELNFVAFWTLLDKKEEIPVWGITLIWGTWVDNLPRQTAKITWWYKNGVLAPGKKSTVQVYEIPETESSEVLKFYNMLMDCEF